MKNDFENTKYRKALIEKNHPDFKTINVLVYFLPFFLCIIKLVYAVPLPATSTHHECVSIFYAIYTLQNAICGDCVNNILFRQELLIYV